MQNKIYFFSIAISIVMTTNSMNINNENDNFNIPKNLAGNSMLQGFIEIVEDMQQQVQQRTNQRKMEYLNILNSNSSSNALKDFAQKGLEKMNQQEESLNNTYTKFAELGIDSSKNIMNAMINSYAEKPKLESQEKIAINTAAINADFNRKKWIDTLNFLQDRKNMVTLGIGAAAIAGGIYGMKNGTELVANLIKHYYRNPSLSSNTSLLSLKEKFQKFVWGKKIIKYSTEDVILEPNLQNKISSITRSIKEAVKNDFNLPNILFYGSPGTGKTMIAKAIAHSSNMDYIYFAASDLDKFSTGEAILKLSELFEFAKKSSKKLIIIIDEAEILFQRRTSSLSEHTGKILTHIMTYTGTENPDYMLILMTNLPDKLDPAIRSRLNYTIKINIPNINERVGILKKYFRDYITNIKQKDPKTLFSKLYSYINKKPIINLIKIKEGILTEKFIYEIAEKIDGFVGRDIAKMVQSIQAMATISPNREVTTEIINQVIQDKIAETKEQFVNQIS